MTSSSSDLESLYREKRAAIGIIGLGYVGMPLALAAWTAGFRVIGFNIDREKIDAINGGKSYLKHIPSTEVATAVQAGRLRATARISDLSQADA